MNIVRGVSRAINGSKAVRLSLSVGVQSIIGMKETSSIVVELERGKHKVDGEAKLNQENNTLFLEEPLSVPLTLFCDTKKGFKSKYFTIRIKNQKKVLADMGQLDIANFAKSEDASTNLTLESNGIKINICIECMYIEEAGDIDDGSTMQGGEQDQDLDGFDLQNCSSVVREELNAGNFDAENDFPLPPSTYTPSKKSSSSSPRLKEKRRARNSTSPSPYRNLGAVEELARQLRVAKGERDDALQKLGETQKLLSGENSIDVLHDRANQAEASLAEAKAELGSLKIQYNSQKETLETIEKKLKIKDEEITKYMTDLNSLKGKSIAQESESASRINSLEEKLKSMIDNAQASDNEKVLALEAKLKSTQELSNHLREQLDMTRRNQSEMKEDLASVTAERNELRDNGKIMEGVMKEAVSRASLAENSVTELETKLNELEKARESDSELANTREGAMRATAHFRIKELESGIEALSADHDQALARATELAENQVALQKVKDDHIKFLNDLSKACGGEVKEDRNVKEVSSRVFEKLESLKGLEKNLGENKNSHEQALVGIKQELSQSEKEIEKLKAKQKLLMKEKDDAIEKVSQLQQELPSKQVTEKEEVVHDHSLDCSKMKKDIPSFVWGRFVLLTKEKYHFVKQAAKEITTTSKSSLLSFADFYLLLERVGFLNLNDDIVNKIISILNNQVSLEDIINEVYSADYDFLKLITISEQTKQNLEIINQLKQEVKDNQLSVTTLQKQMKKSKQEHEKIVDSMKKDFLSKLQQAIKKEREAAVEADSQKMSQELKKKEKALAAQEAALQYSSLRAQDKEEEMLQLVVSAKMSFAQAKEELDALKRENTRLTQLISEVKGQLANAKAAHEDMEATCQHALASHKASATELEMLKKSSSSKKGSFFFS